MLDKEIQYSTTSEQIDKLKSQNLIFKDESFAYEALRTFGYSNIIKSYRDPYTILSDGKKVFRSNVTFEQIFSLYILDKNIRNAVIAAMLDLEEYIKESAADVIAKSFGVNQADYLRFSNYKNKKKRIERFSLRKILEVMNNTLNTDKNPIAHYANKYNSVPPWILFKSVYLSTIVNFIDMFKTPQLRDMVEHIYALDSINATVDQLSKIMTDTLFMCLEYRNLAAHGARIYNHESKTIIDKTVNSHGFSQLLYALSLLKYDEPYTNLHKALDVEINRHCKLFPEDVPYLRNTLNMNIKSYQYVYITPNNKVFHNDIRCSGMKMANEIDFDEAIKHGYKPCKRCSHVRQKEKTPV